jgi:hypothetical protein
VPYSSRSYLKLRHDVHVEAKQHGSQAVPPALSLDQHSTLGFGCHPGVCDPAVAQSHVVESRFRQQLVHRARGEVSDVVFSGEVELPANVLPDRRVRLLKRVVQRRNPEHCVRRESSPRRLDEALRVSGGCNDAPHRDDVERCEPRHRNHTEEAIRADAGGGHVPRSPGRCRAYTHPSRARAPSPRRNRDRLRYPVDAGRVSSTQGAPEPNRNSSVSLRSSTRRRPIRAPGSNSPCDRRPRAGRTRTVDTRGSETHCG